MLSLNNVVKKFGHQTVLSGINLEISNQGVTGLLGPNGAGKTTLMRLICGFYKLSSGEINWNNNLVDPSDQNFKKLIGYLPENNPLYLWLTAGEYLKYIAQLKGVTDPEGDVVKVASECGLGEVLNRKLETLSKGYRQRVGLAAAILGDPQILILDEPTSGLDPNQIVEVRQLIKTLAKNKVVLFSTHILPEAQNLCQRLVIINRGKIVLDEETAKVKNLEKKFISLTI
jgi:ABC-2 type transport system ATP-binding protein